MKLYLLKNIFNKNYKYTDHDKIEFYDDFNDEIDISENDNLHTMIFGEEFNQQINKYPKNLRILEFGNMYNQSLNNLPESLSVLIFKFMFNQQVNNLPKSINTVLFGMLFNNYINNLPKSINTINLSLFLDRIEYNKNIPKILLNSKGGSLSSLSCSKKINNLPAFLHTLKIGGHFNNNVNNLPNKLKVLMFGYFFNKSINKISLSLKTLKIGWFYNYNLDLLPEGLEILDISDNNFRINNNIKINDLPSSIKQIIINENQENLVNKIYKHKIVITKVNN